MLDAMRIVCDRLGLKVGKPDGEDSPDGLYEDEGLDDRLARKARLAFHAGDGYDDEGNDDGV